MRLLAEVERDVLKLARIGRVVEKIGNFEMVNCRSRNGSR
jgi:hypothetical protein